MYCRCVVLDVGRVYLSWKPNLRGGMRSRYKTFKCWVHLVYSYNRNHLDYVFWINFTIIIPSWSCSVRSDNILCSQCTQFILTISNYAKIIYLKLNGNTRFLFAMSQWTKLTLQWFGKLKQWNRKGIHLENSFTK